MLKKIAEKYFGDRKANVRRAVIAVLAVVFVLFLYQLNQVQKPELVTTVGRTFEHARVVEVVKDNLQEDGHRYGEQQVRLLMLSGSKQGQTVDATSAAGYLFGAGCTPGMEVIAIQSVSGDISVTSVYSADREKVIYVFVLLFFLLLSIIAGKQGIKSSIGLIFTLACIFWLYLPLVFRGFSPFWAAVLVAAVTTVVTVYLIGGPTKKSACAMIGTVSGVIIAGAAAVIFGYFSGVSGYNVSDIENLLFLADSTKIQVGGLLFSGLLISSLGAAIDISISIASTINEIHESNPTLGRAALFSSGMRVGRDIMGSNAATLILAFAGGSLSMLVSNYVYDLPYIQIVNSYGIGIEIMQAFSASFGIILAVPIVAAVSAIWMGPSHAVPAAVIETPALSPGEAAILPATAENLPEDAAPADAFSSVVISHIKQLTPALSEGKRALFLHWKGITIAVCLFILAFCGLQFYSAYMEYQNAGKEYRQAEQSMESSSASSIKGTAAPLESGTPEEKPFVFDYEKLAAQNSDAAGWLRLPDTGLSYPVVQGNDNFYYLTHTFYKNQNTAGAIFLDSRISDGLPAQHSILYGHNMRDGTMFAELLRFREKAYWEQHRTLELYSEGGKAICEVFSVHEAAPDSETYTLSFPNQSKYEQYLKAMTKLALYDTGVTVSPSSQIVTLSTCVDDQRDMRFVVQAKKIQAV